MDLNDYKNFVDGITSEPSKDNNKLIERIKDLDSKGVNVARLLTSGLGLPGEAGEFSDIVKKVCFHGKEYSVEVHEKLLKEAGDIAWYWAQGCLALDVDPYKVLELNMEKLAGKNGRYKDGKFTIEASENRKPNDK